MILEIISTVIHVCDLTLMSIHFRGYSFFLLLAWEKKRYSYYQIDAMKWMGLIVLINLLSNCSVVQVREALSGICRRKVIFWDWIENTFCGAGNKFTHFFYFARFIKHQEESSPPPRPPMEVLSKRHKCHFVTMTTTIYYLMHNADVNL